MYCKSGAKLIVVHSTLNPNNFLKTIEIKKLSDHSIDLNEIYRIN